MVDCLILVMYHCDKATVGTFFDVYCHFDHVTAHASLSICKAVDWHKLSENSTCLQPQAACARIYQSMQSV